MYIFAAEMLQQKKINMIYRGEIYCGSVQKSLFVFYGTYENVGKVLGMVDMSLSDEEYPYRTCSQLSLWQYWFVRPYYTVQEWVLRKLG